LPALTEALGRLARTLLAKGRAFDHIVKAGRTHLQDATPVRLGQEFTAYGHTVERNGARIVREADDLRDLGIGGTAVGTGLNAEPEYPALMVKHLRAMTKLDLRIGQDRVQLMQSMGDAAAFSGALRTYAVDLGKIASDLRLMASAAHRPRRNRAAGGAAGVEHHARQSESLDSRDGEPGLFQVLGNDVTVATAAEAGQLELNVMMPVIAHNLFLDDDSNQRVARARRAVRGGIEADRRKPHIRAQPGW
jgi:aspartate ammonia-lyase